MNKKFTEIKNWISSNFQFITVGILVFTIALILKQQIDIYSLKSQLDYLEYDTSSIRNDIDDVKSKLDDVESRLQEIESNLSSEIDDVKRTVRIWCY